MIKTEFLFLEVKYSEKDIFSSQSNIRNIWFKEKKSVCQDNHTALNPMNITCSLFSVMRKGNCTEFLNASC